MNQNHVECRWCSDPIEECQAANDTTLWVHGHGKVGCENDRTQRAEPPKSSDEDLVRGDVERVGFTYNPARLPIFYANLWRAVHDLGSSGGGP